MEVPWYCCGVVVLVLLLCTVVMMLWCCCVLLWCCCSAVVLLLWCCYGAVMVQEVCPHESRFLPEFPCDSNPKRERVYALVYNALRIILRLPGKVSDHAWKLVRS